VAGIEGLSQADRRRLDRFGDAFDHLQSEVYALLADLPNRDGAPDATERDAWGRLSASRREAVQAAVAVFQREAELNYARNLRIDFLPPFLRTSFPTRADDQAKVMAGLRRAVLAIAAWDDLSSEDRLTLLGGWARVAERAGLEP
jgi:hypothetical protein